MNHRPDTEKGFTLLEVMLVFVLLGMTAAAVVPRLPQNNGARQLDQVAEKLVAQMRFAHETALTDGQVLGFRYVPNQRSYEFLYQNERQWVPVHKRRYLKAEQLPEDIQLIFKPGDDFWAPLREQDSLIQSGNIKPQIYFWNSGEVSPASIQLCSIEEKQTCRSIIIKASADIYVQPS